LRQQFDMKFFAQLSAVSYGAEKLADGGSIVLTTGALAKRPGKGSTALATANAALDNIVKGLANDLGPRLRVNSVSPGLTDTEIWSTLPVTVKEGMLAGFGASIPAGRAGRSDDVGHAIRFLLENDFVTGTVIDVDGGAAIRP
jgi:NAD(P)-dependent dehydrogenase (short-subunit alcohol dehydrogenase family)